jgi:hypothetical protein
MQSTDQDQCYAQLRKLFAGFDLAPSEDRLEAFWTGLTKMSLPQLSRAVEYALSEDYDEKLKAVHQVWDIHRQLRHRGPNAVPEAAPSDQPVATLAAQLCAYAVAKIRPTSGEAARPWEYIYREWWIEGKPNAELIAVRIERDTGTVTRVAVADMLGDREGYARALRSFAPGPKPTSRIEAAPSPEWA